MDGCDPVATLPRELLISILGLLSPRELGRCLRVSRAWAERAKDSTVWKALCEKRWAQGKAARCSVNWQEVYRTCDVWTQGSRGGHTSRPLRLEERDFLEALEIARSDYDSELARRDAAFEALEARHRATAAALTRTRSELTAAAVDGEKLSRMLRQMCVQALQDRYNHDSERGRLQDNAAPPIGDVTLLFTDVQGSTVQWEEFPEPMAAALLLHNQTIRSLLPRFNGYEVKSEGDAFMLAFQSPHDAAACAVAIQEAFVELEWPEAILAHQFSAPMADLDSPQPGKFLWRGLRVRMGMHSGAPKCERDPTTRRMDYFGPMVNKAARVESMAFGGQILISDVVRDALQCYPQLDSVAMIKDHGTFYLKGIKDAARIYEIVPSQLSGRTFPSLEISNSRTDPGSAETAAKKVVNLALPSPSFLNSTTTADRLLLPSPTHTKLPVSTREVEAIMESFNKHASLSDLSNLEDDDDSLSVSQYGTSSPVPKSPAINAGFSPPAAYLKRDDIRKSDPRQVAEVLLSRRRRLYGETAINQQTSGNTLNFATTTTGSQRNLSGGSSTGAFEIESPQFSVRSASHTYMDRAAQDREIRALRRELDAAQAKVITLEAAERSRDEREAARRKADQKSEREKILELMIGRKSIMDQLESSGSETTSPNSESHENNKNRDNQSDDGTVPLGRRRSMSVDDTRMTQMRRLSRAGLPPLHEEA